MQDDYTPSKKLSLSFGLALRSAVASRRPWNFAPRVGFTWTPGKYTVRGGYGIFNDWYESNIYEQTLRVNGVTQQELVVQNPIYPDTTGGALANPLPPSKDRRRSGCRCRTCTRRRWASNGRSSRRCG